MSVPPDTRPAATEQSKTVANAEKATFIVVIAALFAISMGFLASALLRHGQFDWNLVIVALIAFAMALLCYFVSPANQSRTLRLLMEQLPDKKPVDAGDLVLLQKTVGSAGFFNRIGLTGIPLAVALMALVFCGLTFLAHWKGGDLQAGFMDLAKLTVGAFIGALTKSGTAKEQETDD